MTDSETSSPTPQSWSMLTAGRRPPVGPRPVPPDTLPTTVIIDDDPTGPQCVRDVPVITSWTEDDLAWGLAQQSTCLFVLTNSRSLSPVAADGITRQVVGNAVKVVGGDSTMLRFLSRSDSTLRGHFPVETDAILTTLEELTNPPRTSVVVLAPAFPSAGRVTLDAVHWLVDGDIATPVAMSDYALDRTFHYGESDLRAWVREKAGPDTVVAHVGLDCIRDGAQNVAAVLQAAPDRSVVVVDAIDDSDLDVLAAAVTSVEVSGRRVVLRGGPGLARALAGQQLPPPLTDLELSHLVTGDRQHGLIVAGSHVSLSTRQLALVEGVINVEVDVDDLLCADPSIDKYVDLVCRNLRTGDTMLSTSRQLRHGEDEATSLTISQCVASGLVGITRGVLDTMKPAWLLGKGGVTSSDLVSKSAGLKRAFVVGQLLPGLVPIWQSAEPNKHPWPPCVIFPGNVGGDDGLAVCVDRMRTAAAAAAS